MSQESSNRAAIASAVEKYLSRLPEPKELPECIEIKINYKEGVERHKVALGERESFSNGSELSRRGGNSGVRNADAALDNTK